MLRPSTEASLHAEEWNGRWAHAEGGIPQGDKAEVQMQTNVARQRSEQLTEMRGAGSARRVIRIDRLFREPSKRRK